ncbi:MAG TPA: hypothetical protein VF248_07300, partial [Nitrososphaeraceae archaeon]
LFTHIPNSLRENSLKNSRSEAIKGIPWANASNIAPDPEDTYGSKTIFVLLLLITLLTTNLIYLWLEGTLSNLVIFYHAELLTIRRIAIDVKVESEIVTLAISLE